MNPTIIAIAAAAVLASSGAWAAKMTDKVADDWATTTVRAWKLAAGRCNKTLNLKGRECGTGLV